MKLSLYCTCGDSATGTIKPDANAQRFIDVTWKSVHSGSGHEPCDAKTAAKARRKHWKKMKEASDARAADPAYQLASRFASTETEK